jgi:hypothetical protein
MTQCLSGRYFGPRPELPWKTSTAGSFALDGGAKISTGTVFPLLA